MGACVSDCDTDARGWRKPSISPQKEYGFPRSRLPLCAQLGLVSGWLAVAVDAVDGPGGDLGGFRNLKVG